MYSFSVLFGRPLTKGLTSGFPFFLITIHVTVTRTVNLLGRIRKYLDTDTCKLLYMTLVQPLMELIL